MPDRLPAIEKLFKFSEDQGYQLLQTLGNANLQIGAYHVIKDDKNRPNILHDMLGFPAWSDILITLDEPENVVALNLSFSSLHTQWHAVAREMHRKQENRESVDPSDIVEILVIASLVREDVPATAIIEMLAGMRQAAVDILVPLLGRGTARLRSAISRALAATRLSSALEALLAYLPKEEAPGVRGDIIIALMSAQDPNFLSREVFYGWLKGTTFSDALVTLLTFAKLSPFLPIEFYDQLNPDFQEALICWFDK